MAPVQDPPNENISWHILVGTIVTIIPATICVILRFIARYIPGIGLWWDDYTIAASLVVNWGMAALRWAQIALYDYGRHSQYVTKEQRIGFLKSFLAVQILYFTNAVLTKASLLLLFHRIFGVVRWFRWVLWASGVLVICYFIACVIASIAGCSPVAKFWDTDIPGHCINEIAFFRWNGVANMILDFLVLSLPFPMAWRVNTTLRQKLILTGIFLLGSFVCIVSILRVVSFDNANPNDPTFSNVNPATWSSVEQSVGIICACLPTLRPLFRRLYGSSRADSHMDGSSSYDDQHPTSLPRRLSQYDDDSSILGFAQSNSTRHDMRSTSSHQLEVMQSMNRAPTVHEDNDRPISQASYMNMNRQVSAAKSFG
ncbi:hypothetical protein N7457_005827 [Penicillium paradoxum]|uniref:uncharacterized protein n=1 Tax=Penicillium paradoxum TaxID=176176 RepID=UPI002547DAA6|nr:uncharacterized protein N7457_005827 [Penicillium paradoxum]KAJ5780667.1 hypothetical protein N7457_005827 [Penicillium paradoxum]